MRRISTIIVAIVVFFVVSLAFARGLEVGAKGGLNFANSYDAANSWKTGFCVGGFIALVINNVFAIQPEILYTQKGSMFSISLHEQIQTTVRKLDYLEIPIFVKLTELTQGMFKPYLLGGPYIAYNLTATLKSEYDGDVDEYDIDEDIKDWDYGIAIGGGFDLVLPKGEIVVDGRYTWGLTPIGIYDKKNRAISFMLGYGLPL